MYRTFLVGTLITDHTSHQNRIMIQFTSRSGQKNSESAIEAALDRHQSEIVSAVNVARARAQIADKLFLDEAAAMGSLSAWWQIDGRYRFCRGHGSLTVRSCDECGGI